jgi:HEPN domain-containing protein
MQPLTVEWIEKAEGDYNTALREMRARKAPNYDSACFHAQQCAEKYLKARLQEEGIPFPMTHNLVTLLSLLLPLEPTWTVLTPDLQTLTLYAVSTRYPGSSAARSDARNAVNLCRDVRSRVRQSLGLPL